MSSYSTDIDLGFDTKTFNDIKDTYLFLKAVNEKLNFDAPSFSAKFYYKIGEMRCTSDSYEEFCRTAFGQTIDFNHFSFFIDSNEKNIAFISVHRNNEDKNTSLNSSDFAVIDKVIDAINAVKEGQSQALTSVVNNYYDSSIKVQDAVVTDSIIGGERNTIKKDTSPKVGFWSSIWANILSNWIWFILLSVASAILLFIKNIA